MRLSAKKWRHTRIEVMPRSGVRWVAGLLLIFGCAGGEKRSVVLITIDTLRADHLSAYGYERRTSPAIEELASRGVRFTHAFSASSSTAPSHASILTGLYPSFHSIGVLNGVHRLHDSTTTLTEITAAHRYQTVAIVSNFKLKRSLGLDQGFVVYDDDLEGWELNRNEAERYSNVAVERAMDWLEAHGDAPFFLWLHLQDPHGPYLPPEGYQCRDELSASGDGDSELSVGSDQSGYRSIPSYQAVGDQLRVESYRHRYDCEIDFLDSHLGRLLEYLKEPRFRNTLVVLTADHGEAFGEDGFYFSHSHSVGLDQVHVPLIMVGPGLPPNVSVETPVSHISIFGTVLDFLGLPQPENTLSQSLLKVVESEEAAQPFFVESASQVGLVEGDFFLRRDRQIGTDTYESFWRRNPNTGGFWKPLGEELLSLNPDQEELSEETRARMAARLLKFERASIRMQTTLAPYRQRIPVESKDREALKSLGYVN